MLDAKKRAKEYTTKVLFGFLTKLGSEEDFIAGYNVSKKDCLHLLEDILNNYKGQKINSDLIDTIIGDFDV